MSVLDDLVANVLTAAQPSDSFGVATVTAVAANAAADGNALVTVSFRGATFRAPYLAAYTPAVGHVVLMARFGPQVIVLGRIIGTPA